MDDGYLSSVCHARITAVLDHRCAGSPLYRINTVRELN
jgi:hypothetical protein